VAELAPTDTRAHLVMQLPFPARDVVREDWHEPLAVAIDGAQDTTYPHDLRLQQYAADLGDDIRAALPHRTRSAELSWPGAWIDLWSLEVVCATVVQAVDAETVAGDWPAYREWVEVQREAVRARMTGELGREPLWLGLFHVVQAPASVDALDRLAATLTDKGRRCKLDAFPDVAVRLGLDACVAIPPGRMDVALGVTRMIGAHCVIWAAAMDFDRELLPLLVRANERESLGELEARADRLRETSRRVRAFRAPLGNTATHLSELDGPLWSAIADRWALDPQLEALSGRVDDLQHIHADLIATLTAKHAQRLNRIALALALISGCTAVFAVVQFVIVEPKPTELRVANAIIVLTVAALAGLLWWTIFKRTGPR
jgi:hypothetical protein